MDLKHSKGRIFLKKFLIKSKFIFICSNLFRKSIIFLSLDFIRLSIFPPAEFNKLYPLINSFWLELNINKIIREFIFFTSVELLKLFLHKFKLS